MADVTNPFAFPYPEDTDLVRDGAQDIENLAIGVNDYLAGGYLYAGTRYYTSSGTFAKADPLGTGDIGLRAVRVRMVGGGGGGAGCSATTAGQVSAGGCGGGAGYSEKFWLVADLSTSETVTVGAGGAAGAAGVNSGTAGAASQFKIQTASGGQGGTAEAAQLFAAQIPGTGGAGGSGANADLIVPGTSGDIILALSADRQRQLAGGGSFLSGSYGSAVVIIRGSGNAGITPLGIGVGGGGAQNIQNNATARAGAAGTAGIVIFDCYV
jgi:hypothetical protein